MTACRVYYGVVVISILLVRSILQIKNNYFEDICENIEQRCEYKVSAPPRCEHEAVTIVTATSVLVYRWRTARFLNAPLAAVVGVARLGHIFPPNLATTAASRCSYGCQIGREI